MNIGPISLFSVDQPWNSLFHPFYSILCMHMHFQRCRVECYWMSCALNPQQTPNKRSATAHLTVSLGVPDVPDNWRGQIACGLCCRSPPGPWGPGLRAADAHDRRGSVGSEPDQLGRWDQKAPETCHGSLWHLKDT